MKIGDKKRIHFISIGGAAMHSLAIALKQLGNDVTGSDDEVFDPASTNLKNNGLLPESFGWHPEKITKELDYIILGMHAREDNPELLKAKELGLKIYSFPEVIRLFSEHKQRIVIAGSHGKTTIVSVIIHILNFIGKNFDYLVGSSVPGIQGQVKLSDAPIIIIEGDEYFTSPIDKTPKFLKYEHHIGLISGIAWDHINAYPTYEKYVEQFDEFADKTPKAGTLVFCAEDDMAVVVGRKEREDVTQIEYSLPKHKIVDGETYLLTDFGDVKLQVFGNHNLRNIEGARHLLKGVGVTAKQFYEAITSFKGAGRRLELKCQGVTSKLYLDFAHAPSKVLATVNSLKRQYPEKRLKAVLELHTFSSLNREFIGQYEDSMNMADEAVVFIDPENRKPGLKKPTVEETITAFRHRNLRVPVNLNELEDVVLNDNYKDTILLMMSSGRFGGLDINKVENLIKEQ